MKKSIEYVFFRIYIRNINKKKLIDDSLWMAFATVSLLMFSKFIILFEIIDIIYKINLFGEISKLLIIITMLVIMIINYFWFIYKKKYLEIIVNYKNETEKQKLVRGLLIFLYFILVIATIVILAYIGKNRIQ